MDQTVSAQVPDTGLLCLVAMARFHQMAADPAQLQHQFSKAGSALTDVELLRAAKALSFKATLIPTDLTQINNATLPAIAKAKDGDLTP